MGRRPVIALFIEGTYPWYRGGVSEWVAQYIGAFPDYDFNIIQIATDPYLQTDLADALYDIPRQVQQFRRIEPPDYNKNWGLPAESWFLSNFEYLKTAFISADIIHVTNTGFAGWLGKRVAEKICKKMILTEHALYWKEIKMGAAALECGYKVPEHPAEQSQAMRMFKTIAAQIYEASNEIISVSECNIADQQALGADKVHYIPNGVDENWLEPNKKRNGDRLPVIGWIGRCAEMKNPLKFFDVIDAFHNQGSMNGHFIMMICDANEPVLQQEVTQRSKEYPMLKLICNRPAREFLHEMDMLCITSRNESQPLVLFEALSKKVLPVGWEAGDVTKKYGIILSSDTETDDLVRKIIAVWNQPDAWINIVNDKYKMIDEYHTWRHIFKQYRILFHPYITQSGGYGR